MHGSATPVPEETDANGKNCLLHGVYGALGFSAKRRHIRCALLARMGWSDARDA